MNKKQSETDMEEIRKILKEGAVKDFEIVPVNAEPEEFWKQIKPIAEASDEKPEKNNG